MAYGTTVYTPKEITSLMNLVDTYVRKKTYDQRGDRSYAHYHPSEWGKCLRLQQYKHYAWKGLINVEFSGVDSTKQRLFDKGHSMHRRWREYFDDIGNVLMGRWKCKNILCNMFDDKGVLQTPARSWDVEKLYSSKKSRIYGNDKPIFRPKKCLCGCCDFDYLETTLKASELNIKGSADIILNFDNLKEKRFEGVRITYNPKFLPIKGSRVIGDMKTAGSNSWKNQLLRKGPHKEYLIQLTIYVHILDCDYGVVMYENKDNSEMLWYQVPRNDRWWEIIRDQAKTMIKMANGKKKKLPPPRYMAKNSYSCKYCDFKSLCHKSAVWDRPDFKEKVEDFYKELL